MDEQPKKGSLRGRGHDIMRGPSEDEEQSPSARQQSGSWLPQSDEINADEEPYFEDEDALLKWMEVDPEEHRPTTVPNASLLKDLPTTGDLYPDPDFDSIFGSQESTAAATRRPVPSLEEQDDSDLMEPEFLSESPTMQMPISRKTETQTLDDIFAEPDPSFDDLFGDVVPVMPDRPTEELPLPQTSELFADDWEPQAAVSQPYDEEPESEFEESPEYAASDEADYYAEEDEAPHEIERFAVSDEADYYAEEDEVPHEVERFAVSDEPDYYAEEDEVPHEVERFAVSDEADYYAEEDEAPQEVEQYATEMAADDDDFLFEDDESAVQPSSLPEYEPVEAVYGIAKPLRADYEAEFVPEPEEADESLIFDDLDEEFAVRADRRSPVMYEAYDEAPEEDQAEVIEALEEGKVTALEELAPEGTAVEEQPVVNEALEMEEPSYELTELPETPVEGIESVQPDWLFDEEPMMTEPISGDDDLTEAEAFIAQLERDAAEGSGEQVPEEEWVSVEETVPTTVKADLPEESVADIVKESPDLLPPAVTPTFTPSKTEYGEAVPLAEADGAQMVDLRQESVKRGAVEKLIPSEPETLPAGQLPFDIYEEEDEAYSGERFEHVLEKAGEGSEVTRSGDLATAAQSTPDPFGERLPRRPAKEIFVPASVAPDQDLLALFVDENRLRELFAQIEALQEEIVDNVRGDRGNTDTYQEELLQASNLLMQSKENYDEARAIVYRVRSDLNRERRVDADIAKYRPVLTNIYIGLAIFIVVLALLGQLFISVAETVGVPLIGHGYYPALFGAIGAWLSGVFAIYRHTIVQRDFDPNHVNWYIINPLIGLVSGFLAYLVLLVPNTTSLSTSFEVIGSSPFTWIIAAGVGLNQNALIELLNSARQRIPLSSGSQQQNERQ